MKSFASVFSERSNSQEDKNNSESKTIGASMKNLKYMSNDEILEQIDIEELFTESSCSEHENHTSKINIWYIQRGGKWKIPLQSIKQRVIWYPYLSCWVERSFMWLWNTSLKETQDHSPCDIKKYVDTMLEDGEPEIVSFSELHGVNVYVYNAMISITPY